MFRFVVLQSLGWSALFFLGFAFVRVPLMRSSTTKHFIAVGEHGNEALDPSQAFGNAFLHSATTQSTVGNSGILPISAGAKLITALQAASTVVIFGLILILAAVLPHKFTQPDHCVCVPPPADATAHRMKTKSPRQPRPINMYNTRPPFRPAFYEPSQRMYSY